MFKSEVPQIVLSRRVPTEYDVEVRALLGLLPLVVLVDDRCRRFAGLTLRAAFRKAEKAQCPADPIHHPPYPSPEEAPTP